MESLIKVDMADADIAVESVTKAFIDILNCCSVNKHKVDVTNTALRSLSTTLRDVVPRCAGTVEISNNSFNG